MVQEIRDVVSTVDFYMTDVEGFKSHFDGRDEHFLKFMQSDQQKQAYEIV